jgi:hypothetical protein
MSWAHLALESDLTLPLLGVPRFMAKERAKDDEEALVAHQIKIDHRAHRFCGEGRHGWRAVLEILRTRTFRRK